MLKRINTNTRRRKTVALVVIGLVLLWLTLEITGVTHLTNLHKPKVHTANQLTKGEPDNPDSTQGTEQSADTINSSESDQGGTSTPDKNGDAQSSEPTKLVKPSGVFVSNHMASLSNAGMNKEDSNCNTSPGATCQIVFTNGNVQKSLKSTKTDAGGSVYWSWKLQDIGLYPGTWEVKAISTWGTQTETSIDAVKLEVSS